MSWTEHDGAAPVDATRPVTPDRDPTPVLLCPVCWEPFAADPAPGCTEASMHGGLTPWTMPPDQLDRIAGIVMARQPKPPPPDPITEPDGYKLWLIFADPNTLPADLVEVQRDLWRVTWEGRRHG